jgi:hypothetical protein
LSFAGLVKSKRLSLLLVVALLLCHGVFGALHLCSTPPVPTHQDHEHASFVDEVLDAHEHTACHLTGVDYFAVLFGSFLGLILGLLLKGVRSWVDAIAPLIIVGSRFTPVVVHPRREPTLTVLQVFRM